MDVLTNMIDNHFTIYVYIESSHCALCYMSIASQQSWNEIKINKTKFSTIAHLGAEKDAQY